ncbi:hypothetical protein [Oceanobacillus halophilus]|uniref:Uncharacterized protein n=1 Tax=Oceanobacillus halophilus TaxID=930130 RepID=A0A495A4P1_9BACI|nr:hypothetical protein [Oceanobacillus halophilus]RKQ33267.1 hypothetical protein D8M06_10875 [Oceanobacillus halophilus]
MSKKKVEERVYRCANQLVAKKGYVSPADLLVQMERLTPKQLEDWRFKRIPYLEKVTLGNLSKMNHILSTLKKYADENNLKPSITVYKSWGKGAKRTLQFSKKGNPNLEKLYATHYVSRNIGSRQN